MNAQQAREILSFAKTNETYEGPIPEDDEKAVSEASDLVTMAKIAWDQNGARGPEVEGVLRLADESFDGSSGPLAESPGPSGDAPATAEAMGRSTNGHGPTEAQDPTEAVEAPQTAPDAPQEAPAAVGADADGEAQPESAPTGGDGDADWMTTDPPWDTYNTDRVADIKDGIDAAADDENYAQNLDLFYEWVYAYESAHKKRVRILRHLEARVAERRGEEPPVEAEHAPEVHEAPAQPDVRELPEVAPEPTPDSPPPPAKASDEERQRRADEIDLDELLREVEEELARERLHVPDPPSEDPPTLPYDYSRVSHAELKALHSMFSAYAYRANYLLMRAERAASLARMMADEMARELLVATAKYDEQGKEKRVTVLEAEIEMDPAVRKLRKIQRRQEIFATAHRQERDSYNRLVEHFSRQETMRHNEWLRSQER